MKSTLKFLSVSAFLILLNYSNVFGQGCVAIRSTGGLCTMDEHPDSAVKGGAWLFNSNTRYYKSFRHFVGKVEQYQRIDQLHLEHRDLDDVICRLSQNPIQDQLQLQRLKKRKLFLKDQITLLERQLTPDIPA